MAQNVHKERTHPVDRVRLEYLVNVPYTEESQIPADAGWQAGDVMDNGDCTALSMPVAELMPERGNHTWDRVSRGTLA